MMGKRLLSLLLIFVMVFSLAATAFAEEGLDEEELVLTEVEPEETANPVEPEETATEIGSAPVNALETYASDVLASGVGDDLLSWSLSTSGVLTISGSGAMKNYIGGSVTPWKDYRDSIYQVSIGSGVTKIGNSAFDGCKNLVSVTLPNSVTSIGESSFYGCSNLRDLTLPSNILSIEASAFKSCTRLLSINIPSSVISIGNSAFSDCSSLTNISLPDSVISMGHNVLAGCSSLTSVKLPAKLTMIPSATFSSCSKLASISIPSTVTVIEDSAFSSCGSLTEVTIPDNVVTLGDNVFHSCSHLVSVTIPNSVTSIGSSAFSGCSTLAKVILPSGLTSISRSMFSSCSTLSSVTIPDSITSIGQYAFSDCGSLASITIPDSVASIGYGVFDRCPKLTSVFVLNPSCSIYSNSTTLGSSITTDIYGAAGSTAETYAKNYGYAFGLANAATPKLTGVSNEPGGVKISWNTVSGALNYRVYYKIGSGDWTKLTDTTDTSYTWAKAAANTTYSFTVRVITADGKFTTSDYDKTGLHITTPAANAEPTETPTKLATPKLKSVSNETGGLKISWSAVEGAEMYRILYKTSEKGEWKPLKDVSSAGYTFKTAKSGTKYWFTIQCVSKDGKTEKSDYNTTGKSITYFAAPKIKAVENTTSGLKISWSKVDGAAKYRIYYKTSENGSWKKLKDVGKVDNYTFKTAKSGTKYWFTVRAMSSTKKTLSGYGSSVKSITYFTTPKLTAVEKTSKGIKLSWSKADGAAKYRIYYKTSADGKWKKLKDVSKVDNYTFKTAKSGTTYWFTVRAMSSTKKTLSGYGSSVMSITYKK